MKHSPPLFNQSNDGKPCKGQFVARILNSDPIPCFILTVKSQETGGNGTVVFTCDLDSMNGTKVEYNVRVILASDGTLRETTQWQCSACECFTTCVCDTAMQSGD